MNAQQPMVLTILEAQVSPEHVDALRTAYNAAAAADLPPQLIRSQLVRGLTDPTCWRIETVWRSREALEEMRRAGTPAGLLMFRAAGAEPTLTMFEVESELPPSAR